MINQRQQEYAKNLCCVITLVVLFPVILFTNINIRFGTSIYMKLILPICILTCFAVGYLIIKYYNGFGKRGKLKDYQWALIVFAASILISAVVFWIMLASGNLGYWKDTYAENYNPVIGYIGGSARMEGILAFFCYFMCFVAGSSITEKKYFKIILGMFIFVLAFSAIFAIPEHFGKFGKGYTRPKAFCGNANFFASFLTMGIAMLSAYIVFTKKYLMLIPAAGLYIVVCFATIYNNSRSAWVGCALAWGAMFVVIVAEFVKKKNFSELIFKGLKLAACGIVFLAVLLTVVKVLEPETYAGRMETTINQITGNDEDDADLPASVTPETAAEIAAKAYGENYVKWGSGRGHSYKWGIYMLAHNPLFGTGPDNYRFAFPNMAYAETKQVYGRALAFDKAHNEYVHLGATLGIVGLFAYMAFITLVLINGYKSIKLEEEENKDEIYKKLLFFTVIGYLGQAYFNISVLQVAPFFWSFMGMLCADYFRKVIVKKKK